MKIEDLFSVRGKVAVVTGGSRGLGEMIARAYVENGVKVYITARRAERASSWRGNCRRSANALPFPPIFRGWMRSIGFAGEIEKRENKLDILVNNAGASWGASFPRISGKWLGQGHGPERQIRFLPDQRLLPLLEAAGSAESYARVINIGSIEGIRTSHLEAYSYAASKAGVNHLTRIMAKFLAPKRIAVNAIAPGYFPSKMTDAIDEQGSSAVVEDAPMKRMGNPDDLAGIALYLASKASAFVCGAVIPVDGGLQRRLDVTPG